MSKRLTPEQKRAAKEALTRHLRRHGIRFTRPRQIILETVLDIDEHFEAEQLLAHLRLSGAKVAKATIYRTLPLLVACGILKQVRFNDTQAYYEHAYGEDPHDHMVCRRCGRIVEFNSEAVSSLTRRLARQHGFHAVGHRYQISGLCKSCLASCPVGDVASEHS